MEDLRYLFSNPYSLRLDVNLLSRVFRDEHKYVEAWEKFPATKNNVEGIIHMISLYQTNSLILTYLLKALKKILFLSSKEVIEDFKDTILTSLSNTIIFFENTETLCMAILADLIDKDSNFLYLFCDICHSTTKLLLNRKIEPSCFIEIINFTCMRLDKNADHYKSSIVFNFLSSLAENVAPSMSCILNFQSTSRYLKKVLFSNSLDSELFGLCLQLTGKILRINIMGNSKSISEIVLPLIFDNLNTLIETKKINKTDFIYEEEIELLTILGDNSLIRNTILNNLPVDSIISLARIISSKNAKTLRSLVDMYIYVYFPLFKSKEYILQFAEIILETIAESLSVNDMSFIKDYSLIIKKFTIFHENIFKWTELSTVIGEIKSSILKSLETENIKSSNVSLHIFDALTSLFGWREVCWSPPQLLSACCNTRESIAKARQSSNDLSLDSIRSDYSTLLISYAQENEFEIDGRRLMLDRIIPIDLFQQINQVSGPTEIDISHISYILLISRSMGTSIINQSVFLDVLGEITVDVLSKLNAENQNDNFEVQEKCLQLLTDIVIERKLGAKPYVNQLYDDSMHFINQWNSYKNDSIIYTCLSVNIACALVNESVRRHISSHLNRYHRLIEIMGVNKVISPILILCQVTISSFHIDNANYNNQEVLFMIVLFGLRSDEVITRNLACSLIVDIESKFPGLMKKMFSRREIEEVLLFRLEAANDGKEVIELLQACSACCRQLNLSSSWTPTVWSFPWQWNRRLILSTQVTNLIQRLLSQIELSFSPSCLHIFALTLGFAVGIMKISSKEAKLDATTLSLTDVVIKFIPIGLRIVIKNQKLIRSMSGREEVGKVAISPHLLLSDYSVDLLHETVAFQTFEAIISFICIGDLKNYTSKRDLFGEVPLSLSIIHVLSRFKYNQNIQRQAIYMLCYFAKSGVDNQVIINKSPEVLAESIPKLQQDIDCVSQFLFILNFIMMNQTMTKMPIENKANQSTESNSDYSIITQHKLEIVFYDLIYGGYISPDETIHALHIFVKLTSNAKTLPSIAQHAKDLAQMFFKILEKPNTSPSSAIILSLTAFTNIYACDDFTERDDKLNRQLLKTGKNRLSKMLKSEEPLPDGFVKNDVEELIGKCSHAENKFIKVVKKVFNKLSNFVY